VTMSNFKATDVFYPLAGVVLLGGIAALFSSGIGGLLSSLFFVYMMLIITNGFDRGAHKQTGNTNGRH